MYKIDLDISDIVSLTDELIPAAKKALQKAGAQLSAMTHAHIVEQASKTLHTRLKLYVDSLSYSQIDENTWIVALDAKAKWIEDGIKPGHSILDDLLKSSKVKHARDGSQFIVVPFKHGPRGPTQSTPVQAKLLDAVKDELKARNIPYAKIERFSDGSPKLGKLHGFDITKAPINTGNPRIGKGPVGSVAQGPTGVPLLQGLSIHQNKGPGGKVQRQIMTFRIASSRHRGTGRWEHPGKDGVFLFDEAVDWAVKEWEQKIVPQIIAELANI